LLSTSNVSGAAANNGTKKPAIVIHEARKTFKLRHTNSLKETFVAALQRKELSSSFNAVDGLSIEVAEGESIALMGRNGSGKSTALKLLSGVMRPDAGWVRTRGRIAGLLEVGAGFNPNLTGRDNVFLNAAILGMSKEETEARFDDIVEFSEIGEFIDTEVKHYSSGMYSRLGFSVAVHTELDVLLVDEILSVGDAAFREKCAERMQLLRDQGKTMFIVSHSTHQVQKLCDRGVVLQRGKVIFDGPIDDAIAFVDPASGNLGSGALNFQVKGHIKSVYERGRSQFGRPLHNELVISENGGGTYQRFEKGLITYSQASGKAFGIVNGQFLEAYLEHDGAMGDWGFLAGTPKGRAASGNRSLEFQHGNAEYDPNKGVRFIEKYLS
jgi:ABC-type polysaccharide/polyol phosphate transport system ATPase subunit